MELSHCQMTDVTSSHSTRIQIQSLIKASFLFPLNRSVFIFISTKKHEFLLINQVIGGYTVNRNLENHTYAKGIVP